MTKTTRWVGLSRNGNGRPVYLREIRSIVLTSGSGRRPTMRPRVLRFERALTGAHENRVPLEIHPDGRHLRRAVSHQRREMGEVGAADERLDLVGKHHAASPPRLSGLNSSSTVAIGRLLTLDRSIRTTAPL